MGLVEGVGELDDRDRALAGAANQSEKERGGKEGEEAGGQQAQGKVKGGVSAGKRAGEPKFQAAEFDEGGARGSSRADNA